MRKALLGLTLGVLTFGGTMLFTGCATSGQSGCACATTMPDCKCSHCKTGEGKCPCGAKDDHDHKDHKH